MSAPSSASGPIHLLKENGAKEAPFADFTLCGLAVTDVTSAMWPGDTLAEHNIRGRWCPACKDAGRKVAHSPEEIADAMVRSNDG